MNELKVVAISGVSGSGKTSVIKQLSRSFACPYLLFDDHTDKNTYPADMKLWFQNGADVSEIKTPKLENLLSGFKVENKSKFVFIEEPFGRCRDSMSSLIDYVILLDMPMEVCLSRVIMRNINHSSNDSLISIPNYLAMYDAHLREIYIETTNLVRESSDFIIQHIDSIESITGLISDWLGSIGNE